MAQQPSTPQRFNLTVPAGREDGQYADFASIWHNNDTFVLDFVAMTRPRRPAEDDSGNKVMQIDCHVVSRVRIPASQAWEVMRGLEKQLTQWEKETGRRPPEAPTEMPGLE